MTDTKSDWKEYFRLFTPFMLILVSIIGWGIREKVSDMQQSITSVQCQVAAFDEKMFKHLTNEEIHIPRATVVNKAEFDLYQKMRDRQMDSMENVVRDIRNMLKENNYK